MDFSSENPRDMSRQRLLQELEATKEQLKKQKILKEMYINRGKETTRELERLRKYSDDVALSNAKIATQVRDNTRQKKKKDLHRDYEELQVAHLVNEEKFQTDLQAEKDKNKLLQKELDQISVSHNEIRLRYETDVIQVRQQVDTLQRDLVKEMQQKTTVEKQYAELQMAHVLSQDNFTAELQVEEQKNKLLHEELDKISQRYKADVNTVRQQTETLQHQLQKEVQQRNLLQQEHEELKKAQTSSHEKLTAELQVEKQKNKLLQDKLDKISASQQETSQRYETEVITVRQQADTLQQELETEVKSHSDTVSKGLQMITNLRAEQDHLRHRMTEEINKLQQNTLEEGCYETHLEELKTPLDLQISLNLELSTEQESIPTPPAPELLEVTQVPEKKPCEQLSIATALAPELLEVTQVSEETLPGKRKKTIWKRARHFLGLRKPKKWKK